MGAGHPQQPGAEGADKDRDLRPVRQRQRSGVDTELAAREAHLLAAQQPGQDLHVLVGVQPRRVIRQAEPVLDDDPV